MLYQSAELLTISNLLAEQGMVGNLKSRQDKLLIKMFIINCQSSQRVSKKNTVVTFFSEVSKDINIQTCEES